MNSTDFQICQHVITAISSKRYEDSNYLFLEPVDVTHFPTYTSLVSKPMDLGTVAQHLKSGHYYKTKQEFLSDTMICFDNAEKFHKDKPENAWIISFAKKMKKYVKKEEKIAMKKFNAAAGSSAGSSSGTGVVAPEDTRKRLSLSSKKNKRISTHTVDGGGNAALNERKKKKKSPSGDTTTTTAAVAVSTTTATSSAAKPKLSLKIGKKSTSPPTAIATATATVSSTTATATTSTARATSITNEKTPKPKLKLKFSSKKTPNTTKNTTPKNNDKNTITTAAAARTGASSLLVVTKQETKSVKKSLSPSSLSTPSSSKTKSTKPTSTPKSNPSTPSRGKELPSAIVEAKANTKKKAKSKKVAAAAAACSSTITGTIATPSSSSITTTTKKPTITLKSSRKTNRTPKAKVTTLVTTAGYDNTIMTLKHKAQCKKVLSALKQRGGPDIQLFLQPVQKMYKIEDYDKKIPFPMDISTMSTKLDKNAYATLADFVIDLRRIFGNCLRFNILSSKDKMRDIARKLFISAESYFNLFVCDGRESTKATHKQLYPKLLYCWKSCLGILDATLDLKNPDDKNQTAHYFLHPASFFFGGELSQAYKDKVKTPMDFGTIASNLLEGTYQTVDAFVRDCRLVTSNCKAASQDDEAIIAQASRLEEFLSPKLDSLSQFDQSEKGFEARKNASIPTVKILTPPILFYTAMIDELRKAKFTDKYTKITELPALQFEDPVDTNLFKDYLQYVESPIDLKTIERRIQTNFYAFPEDFEYDINLIFKNCEAYNIPKQNQHIVNLSKHCAKTFKKMYSARIKAFEASGGKRLFGDDKKDKKRTFENQHVESIAPPAKKIRIESSSIRRKSPDPSSASKQLTIVSKQVKVGSKGKHTKSHEKRTIPRIIIRTEGPLPLHVAIAKIKEGFSRRRQHKELLTWEGACSRFFRELKRHPWVSTSKRFVFDAPVPMLYPEIKEAYAIQIKKPMDLTTAEGKLLQGGLYNHPQEFIDDVSLVFANAVTFNKSGHEQGDPTSMAYFDASKHLLRYTRWLSLEHMTPFLVDDLHSEGMVQSGPLSHWKLTISNQNDARHERENIVMKHEIEKSEEGDQFTWAEVECEKLLKSLRHQTDYKRMIFFLKPDFPPDYFAFISKPMEWETCDKKLQQREYNTYGEMIEDLRLIFTNAMKYNGRVKDIDPTSKVAYDSAIYMSGKLESAIQRMFITAADRIEREKVEDVILSREAVINQKAEEDKLRSEWQNERGNRGNGGISKQSVKIIQRRPIRRDLDFDNPFTEQNNSYEESEMNLINMQKIRYEKQICKREEMHQITRTLGQRKYHDLFWRSQAIHWAKEMSEKIQQNLMQNHKVGKDAIEKDHQYDGNNEGTLKASIVSTLLEDSNRTQIKMQLSQGKKKNKKRKRLFLF